MYSIKSVGPKMEPGVTPSLTGYSYEDFLSGTTWSDILLTKDRIKTNILSESP